MAQINKPKILQILPQEEYFSSTSGGAIATWVKECFYQKDVFNITVCTPKAEDYFPNFKVLKLPINWGIMLGKKLGGKLGHHLQYNLYIVLASIFARFKSFDIIHIHNRPTYVFIAKKLNPKAKVILHMHNDHVLSLNKRQVLNLKKSCDLIISVSNYIQNNIILHFKKNDSNIYDICKVCFNGTNPSKFKVISNIKNENSLLFIGRLLPEKGIKQLMEAVLLVSEKIPEIKLVIAGNSGFGHMDDTLFVKSLKQIAKKKTTTFQFLGYISHEKVPDLFKKTSLYIVPSIWNEPFGIVVLEGMASKIPMIVSNKGGIPEITGNTIISLDCNNIELLAEKIIYALEHKKEMKEYAQKAYKRYINNFTWQHVQNNYITIIKEL